MRGPATSRAGGVDLRRVTSAVILYGVTTAELHSAFAQFVTLAHSVRGDEKSEARDFLERPFPAPGRGQPRSRQNEPA